jgi:ParB/RepB/Spo0J family partition protein
MVKKVNITVPFESIVADDAFNARVEYDEEYIERLANSIQEQGLLQSIGVTEKKSSGQNTKEYFLVFGFCRHRAIQKIRARVGPDAFAEVDVRLVEGTVEDLREKNLIENIERKDLRPFEIAQIIKKMVNSGLEQRDIGARLGRPQSWVSYHYKLATKLTPSAWNAFRSGDLTIEQALNIADIPEETQSEVVEKVLGAETRSEARQVAKKASSEAGTRRTYVNKGRPTAKNLMQFVSDASFNAMGNDNSEEDTKFYHGVAAGLRVALGDFEFKDLSPTDSYTDPNYHARDRKQKDDEPATPKKRGRKPKAKAEVDENAPKKKRGRPPKAASRRLLSDNSSE